WDNYPRVIREVSQTEKDQLKRYFVYGFREDTEEILRKRFCCQVEIDPDYLSFAYWRGSNNIFRGFLNVETGYLYHFIVDFTKCQNDSKRCKKLPKRSRTLFECVLKKWKIDEVTELPETMES